MFWIYFGSLEREEGKKISNGGMRAEEESLVGQGVGRNGRQAVPCKEHWVRYPKMRTPAPHQVTGAALRVP